VVEFLSRTERIISEENEITTCYTITKNTSIKPTAKHLLTGKHHSPIAFLFPGKYVRKILFFFFSNNVRAFRFLSPNVSEKKGTMHMLQHPISLPEGIRAMDTGRA